LNQFKNPSCWRRSGAGTGCAIRSGAPGPFDPGAHAVTPTDRRFGLLRRLALLGAVLVLAVISLSATIRLTKAGLGCADWPQCYGQALRPSPGGDAVAADQQSYVVPVRLAHRAAALISLPLIVAMLVVCFGARPALRAEGAMALALLGLALALAVLGRWSSGTRVPAVAMGNLLGGFAMLALCARLTVAGRALPAPGLRAWPATAALLLLAQAALGGLVSASYAGLSCGDWMDCLRSAHGFGWDSLDPWRENVLAPPPNVNPAGALAQLLHRSLAGILLLLLAPLAVVALRRARPRTGAALLVLLGLQAAAGLSLVAYSLPLPIVLLHNLLAACLLGTLVLLL
jgi:cytochrome c oxidase assembly protein subunit 15